MPAFALDLDPDGIRLLRRDGDGWEEIDSVALDDPMLPKRLKALRVRAEVMAKGPLETELVIPPSQILYTEISATTDDPEAVDVARALDGLTPCPVDEMVFDWRRDGGTIRIAALDINTLDEAESFAVSYGFNPIRFVAWPDPAQFPGTPDFGATQFVQHRAETEAAHAAPAAPATGDPRPIVDPPRIDPPTGAAPTLPPAPPPLNAAPAPRAERHSPSPPSGAWPNRNLWATVAAAVLTCGVLVWTALYLVSPKPQRKLPEVAATPEFQPEEQIAAGEPRREPSRHPPRLVQDSPLPALPATEAALAQEMAARRATTLFAATAPDPESEVGLLDAADFWQVPPRPLIEPTPETADDLYLAAVDPAVRVDDAFALAQPSEDLAALDEPPPPPQPGDVFELDERGFVRATAEGAMTPNGVLVTAGRPVKRPPPRPVTAVIVPDPEIALALAGKSPRARPRDLTDRMERANFGGRTLEELSDMRPRARPASAQQEAADAEGAAPSALAVAVSRAPSHRPADFAVIVATAQQARVTAPETATAVVAAAAAVVPPAGPTIPSSASVARQATIEDAIKLNRLNLIGVYGSDANRRALLRLPSGRYVKVKVGDRIDGGQIASIGDNELTYVKGGRNHTLKVPSS